MLAGRDDSRLAVRFRDELRSPYVGHPDLNRSEALFTQTLPMFAYPIPRTHHETMLHVTLRAGNRLCVSLAHIQAAQERASIGEAGGALASQD